ncbi:hypothetical protein FA15DRAFT_708747 [Coprinopsis marcescibilis]|uniref:Uncharacterized protein n=1 Tax=Coprinopsis marcescibilis TaxID=230819 RepID=A0A5C3KHR5_COPMA|nr:hypothetical protein FA15DRAFT_708747 [Coprinopsis marcescibilis]
MEMGSMLKEHFLKLLKKQDLAFYQQEKAWDPIHWVNGKFVKSDKTNTSIPPFPTPPPLPKTKTPTPRPSSKGKESTIPSFNYQEPRPDPKTTLAIPGVTTPERRDLLNNQNTLQKTRNKQKNQHSPIFSVNLSIPNPTKPEHP